MNKEPTNAEIKEFWEWCGFRRLPNRNRDYHFEVTTKVMDWQAPDDTTMPYPPRIDLNNLFKWAVPKIADEKGRDVLDILLCDWAHSIKYDFNDPALVLFWAIWQVIKE